jgi:hypothetical protein
MKLFEVLPHKILWMERILLPFVCERFSDECMNLFQKYIGSASFDQIDPSLFSQFIGHYFAGSSLNSILHFMQIYQSGKF